MGVLKADRSLLCKDGVSLLGILNSVKMIFQWCANLPPMGPGIASIT